jgi:two-component system osmolarity sensor histidine kinase EnvZ
MATLDPRLWIKAVLPKSLFGRSVLIIVMPLILLQLVSAWIFYDRHWESITWRLSALIAGSISNVIDQVRRDPDDMEEIFSLASQSTEMRYRFEPQAILPNTPTPPGGLLDRVLLTALDTYVSLPVRVDTSRFRDLVRIDIQMREGVLTVEVPGSRLFSSSTYIFLMWMAGTSLVLFAIASVFMRNQIRPIKRLARAADRFGKGRQDEREDEDYKPQGSTEVRQAAHAFNLMRRRILRQIRQRTDMLSGVSHDLRTPLTRMRLQLALLEPGEERAALEAELGEMERMIEGYLDFARGEGGEPPVEVDLGALVGEVLSPFGRTGTPIDGHVEGQIRLVLKPNAMRRLLTNLVANARKYAGNVWLRAGVRNGALEILIDDDGPGIPEAERERVFRPFYRLDRSRNSSTGGTGLGLAIARDIARAHGGEIFLEDSPYGGLRARVRVPL